MSIENPEEAPLLIYDGDCHFCRRWIAGWQKQTGDRVKYAPYQSVGVQYPEISDEAFRGSVHLVESGRKISKSAEAVFRVLSNAPSKKAFLWFYQYVPGFKAVSEFFYSVVAKNRVLFSKLTQFLWGQNTEPSTFHQSAWIFLRALGFIYIFAFFSLSSQILGLFGSEGILPAYGFLDFVSTRMGAGKYWLFPTLFWFNSSDVALLAVCWAGVALGALLVFNLGTKIVLPLLWVLYLSLFSIGQDFLSFQWDILLLEVGFLSLFLLSCSVRQNGFRTQQAHFPVIWLFWWLVFRLMFSSGIVKLLSGDAAWQKLEALRYHYETQPLPTGIGWFFHQLPLFFQKFSVASMFVIELAIPFLIFFPRRIRHFAAFTFIGFQILILLTGNYGFFNWLSIALCFLLLDDAVWPKRIKNRISVDLVQKVGARFWVWIPLFFLIFTSSLPQLSRTLRLPIEWPVIVKQVNYWTRPFRITNGYGLFAIMTTSRLEIQIEGSNDGQTWTPYPFKFKPDDPKKMPPFIAPHQPRLDWQMWFASLGSPRQNPWLVQVCARLLKGSPEVVKLFKENPFKEKPPRFIRAAAYNYQFSDFSELQETGQWWQRKREGLYMRTLSRDGQPL